MYDLTRFRLRDTVECAAHTRKIGAGAGDVDEACRRLCRFFYEALLDGETTRPACAMVRVYKTCPFRSLDEARAAFAVSTFGKERAPAPDTTCVSLMATMGEVPAWCSVTASKGHLAIPLFDPSFLDRLPMIAALVDRMGLDRAAVIRPDPAESARATQKAYDVFYVPDAVADPIVPAKQSFVVPHGIQSVVGFGGALSSGEVLAVLLFSKVRIRPEVAGMFRLLALALRIALTPFVDRALFAPMPRARVPEAVS